MRDADDAVDKRGRNAIGLTITFAFNTGQGAERQ
jgi:hypothetical protein